MKHVFSCRPMCGSVSKPRPTCICLGNANSIRAGNGVIYWSMTADQSPEKETKIYRK